MRIKFFFVSLLMAFMGMTIASCSHDDEKDIPCDDCGKTRIQVVCEGADGVVSRGGSFVGGKVTGAGVYESDYGKVTVQATADAGYYVSYFKGGPENEPNKVNYSGTGESTYSTDANTELGNHMYHIGFKKIARPIKITFVKDENIGLGDETIYGTWNCSGDGVSLTVTYSYVDHEEREYEVVKHEEGEISYKNGQKFMLKVFYDDGYGNVERYTSKLIGFKISVSGNVIYSGTNSPAKGTLLDGGKYVIE